MKDSEPEPYEELLLQFSDPDLQTRHGGRQIRATAVLVYRPADSSVPAAASKPYPF